MRINYHYTVDGIIEAIDDEIFDDWEEIPSSPVSSDSLFIHPSVEDIELPF